ncbi:hypothetical protein HK100_006946, partial [Physocladia obscura]
MVLLPSQLLHAATPKPCKQHGVLQHDLFTSYRVKIDGEFVAKLVPYIENIATRCFSRRVCVFLDTLCLKDGVNWKQGFFDGVHGSYVMLCVLSEESMALMIENVKNGIEDNVLLEIETGLSLACAKLLPILIDREGKKFTKITGHGSLFSPATYPDLPHIKTKINFRETMTALFMNQAIHIVPDLAKIHDVVYDIVDLIAPLSRTS